MGDAPRPRLGARSLMVGAAVVVVLAGLKAAQSLIIPFLLALFLAIICTPAVAWLTRRRVPVGLAVLAVVIVLLAAFSGFGAIVGGSVNEFTAFATQNQARFDGLVKSASTWFEARDIDPASLDLLNMLQPGKLINLLGGVLKNLAGVLSNFFLIMLTMIFMLFEAASFPVKVRAAVGKGRFDLDNLRHAVIQVQRYLGLKTITSLTTGLLVGVWTAILGLDFAVVWGLLAFLLNYIPSIGSIVAAIPPVLLGLVQGGAGLRHPHRHRFCCNQRRHRQFHRAVADGPHSRPVNSGRPPLTGLLGLDVGRRGDVAIGAFDDDHQDPLREHRRPAMDRGHAGQPPRG